MIYITEVFSHFGANQLGIKKQKNEKASTFSQTMDSLMILVLRRKGWQDGIACEGRQSQAEHEVQASTPFNCLISHASLQV